MISASALAFSLETGGLLANDSTFANKEKDGKPKLLQKNNVNLWLRAPFNEDGSTYLAAEGQFRTEYDTDSDIEESSKKLTLAGDVTLFKFVLKNELDSGDIQFSAGRFYNADLSGLIYAQNGDGIKLDANISRFGLSLYGAYTGLLNAKNVTIIEKKEDNAPALTDKKKKLYVLANKYAVGGITFSLNNIVANQTISVEGFGGFSLESTKYNRFYGTLALNGPIVAPIFYEVSSTMGFSSYDKGDMEKGNLTKGSISVYPDFNSMSLSLTGSYASGGKKGGIREFKGFTSQTAVNWLNDAEYSGLIKGGVMASIKPLGNILLNASGDLVFKYNDTDEKFEQAGFQYSAGLNCQALSDVSFGASITQFIGKDDTYNVYNKTQIKLTASIAF